MKNLSIFSAAGAANGDDFIAAWRTDYGVFERLLGTKDESFWTEEGSKKALSLFHEAARRVPAYKDFLKRSHVDHARIRTIADFERVPIANAENYVARYPLAERCWDGTLPGAQLIATSSGTKGEPKFWPRTVRQEFEQALTHEFLYRTYFESDKRTTLLLIGFPMGIYISGMATLIPSWLVSMGRPGLTVMSVGNNKTEMLRTVKSLSDHYEQTVLVGHPYFIKDVIETGVREGIVWSRKRIGMMFCSEGFTEAWRDYVAKKAGMASSVRMFNTYGSSEMLLMAYETATSIGIKRLLEEDANLLQAFAHDPVAPQLFQYNPVLRYIESVNGELAFTSASGLPLIRFNLHDRGMVIPLHVAEDTVRAHREKAADRLFGRRASFSPRLPLVALWAAAITRSSFMARTFIPSM